MNTRAASPIDALSIIRPDRIDEFRRVAAVDAQTTEAAQRIIALVRAGGEPALRDFACRFDATPPHAPLLLDRTALDQAASEIRPETRALLHRTADRIRAFAEAQRAAIRDIDVPVPGGRAGHTVVPIARAGCYAPGGRYPLPSSVLMTAITARAAGCREIIVATPSRDPSMLAAAAIAGADALLNCGGAHAVAALAHGVTGMIEPVDAIVGPGNKWVTAAKQLVNGTVAIDMLAGPSELAVLADEYADPAIVASDLLAQAEHDDDAVPILITNSAALIEAVNRELGAQLETLPTSPTAQVALHNGFACLCSSMDEAVGVSDRIAPEHLEIHARDADAIAARIGNAGAVFIGSNAAEVFADYGLGPNHTLPTGGTARFSAGLSVLDFLRVRTWLRMDRGPIPLAIIEDAEGLARLEGLEAHARAAHARRPDQK